MAENLSENEFRRYALLGAEARLLQIGKEAESIYEAFPELRDQAGSRRGSDRAATGRRRRRGMSAEQREAVRERMKRYWAQRRNAAADEPAADGTADAAADAVTAPVTRKTRAGRKTKGGGKRKMSAAARKRISEAQKTRWAKRKRTTA